MIIAFETLSYIQQEQSWTTCVLPPAFCKICTSQFIFRDLLPSSSIKNCLALHRELVMDLPVDRFVCSCCCWIFFHCWPIRTPWVQSENFVSLATQCYLMWRTVIHLMDGIIRIVMQFHEVLSKCFCMICPHFWWNDPLTIIVWHTNFDFVLWTVAQHSTPHSPRVWGDIPFGMGPFVLALYLSFQLSFFLLYFFHFFSQTNFTLCSYTCLNWALIPSSNTLPIPSYPWILFQSWWRHTMWHNGHIFILLSMHQLFYQLPILQIQAAPPVSLLQATRSSF